MVMGRELLVMWVMGQLRDGLHGSWVTKDDPFPYLPYAHPLPRLGDLGVRDPYPKLQSKIAGKRVHIDEYSPGI